MNRRPIRRCGVDQLRWTKIEQRAACSPDVTGIALGQDQAIEPIHASGTKVLPDDAVIIAERSGVEEPIAFRGPDMHGAAGFQVKDIDFDTGSARPVRMFDVQVTSWNLREELDRSQNGFGQEPIRIVKDD